MQKQEKIVDMFDHIAPTYDMANRVLSLGIDIKWRKLACQKTFAFAQRKDFTQLLDVACGTGDMMDCWYKTAKSQGINIQKLIGIDPSAGMLKVAQKKFKDFEFIQASATSLPNENESVDIISISYGIRNVVQRQEALKEFYRVLKKGGFVVILEFTKSEKKGLLYSLRDFYLHKILPSIGAAISKNKEAYTYLPDSIDNFLSTKKLCEELENTGFTLRFTKGFSMDISTLFIAQKV